MLSFCLTVAMSMAIFSCNSNTRVTSTCKNCHRDYYHLEGEQLIDKRYTIQLNAETLGYKSGAVADKMRANMAKDRKENATNFNALRSKLTKEVKQYLRNKHGDKIASSNISLVSFLTDFVISIDQVSEELFLSLIDDPNTLHIRKVELVKLEG